MKKLMLVMFALILVSLLLAQTDITIGTGTSTGRYPFNDYFVYSRSQCIYLENEIGNPGTIHKLRWFRNDAGADANAIGTTQIWLKTVSNAAMTDTNWEDPGTLVYEISNIDLGAGNAWYEVDITDFNYTGGNLLVSVYTQNAPYTEPHSYWRYTATTGFNRCRMGNSDSVNPPTLSLSTSRPNIQINMTASAPSVAPNPAILASPVNGGWAFIGDILSWNSGGGFPTSYDVYFGTTNPPAFLQNQVATSYTPTLAAGTTYYWNVVARNDFGAATASPTWSFQVPGANNLVESFENTSFPPAGWANPGTWTRSTSTYFHGGASAYKYSSDTALYILSSPKVTITASSSLSFMSYCSTTSSSAIWDVVYSTDRVTWTQVSGSSFTHPTASVWVQRQIDLSALAGNNYYLGIRAGGYSYAYYYIDKVIGPEITPEAPGAPVLTTPADAATDVNEYTSFTWTAPTTGGVPTGYRLYVGTTNPPTTLVNDGNVLTYTLTTPLTYGGTYYWTVEAYNSAGAGPQATVRSYTVRANPLVSTFPWTVDFGTTTAFPPANWTRLDGLYGTTPVSTTSGWTYDDFCNLVTSPQNMSARLNIWSTSTKYWLVTPPIAIPGAGYELKFDLGLTTYSGVNVAPTPGAQADDKFIVLISDSPMMTNPTVLRQWDNAGSAYVFDTISPTGENQIIGLNAYSGTKYIAFYGESTVTGGDNNVYVDNVTVREAPAAPIFALSPTSWDFGQTVINTTKTKQFVISNNGGGNLNISSINISGSYYTLTGNPAPVSLAGGQSATFTVQYLPTAVGTHAGSVTITDNRAVTTVDLTAVCYDPSISVFPYTESFDGETFAPLGWTNIRTAGTSTPGIWDRQTAGTNPTCAPNSGAGMARYNAFSISSGGKAELITPPLNIPANNYRVSFYMYRDTGYPTYIEGVNVYYNTTTTSTGGTLLGTINRSTTLAPVVDATGWYNYSFNLPAGSAGNGRYIVFEGFSAYGNNIFIDDVVISELPAGQPEAVTLNSPANETTGLPIGGFNLSWTPSLTGGTPTSYGIYIASSEEEIYNENYFSTTNTTFNPVTEGGMTFNYLDRWYWTVEAVNDDGSAVVVPPYWFAIEDAPQVISTFPWTENFDAAITAPADWTIANVDGQGTTWVGSTTYSHSAPNSFKHGYSTIPDTGQNGWLITPAIQVPTGNYVISWWNYNGFPAWLVYNGLKVNTTSNPNDPNWVELWAPDTAAAAWSNAVVNISAYAGQTVYFAFNYQGYDADDWYIDDVSIFELLVDEIPPSIAHLPVLNTPRPDINYTVTANITDDPTWNNPIGGANLYYSIDNGTTWSAPIAMTPGTAPAYSANIPAQALGTTVQYYMEAWDSEDNLATSQTYSFNVANPTWIWYDNGGTTYLGYTSYIFGPTVLFQNPFYGTGTPLKLLGTDGSSYYAATANLHVYSYDGTTMTDLITPLAVNFTAQAYQTVDLSSYNLNITTPYFLIAYEDIPAGNYFLFDGTYDYGTTFVKINGSLYTLSNPGSWCIGAYVTNGISALDAPVVTIAEVAGAPVISWGSVAGANNYKVYGAADPYAADPWTMVGSTTDLSYTYNGTEGMKFFKVTADTAAPTRGSVALSKKTLNPTRTNVEATRAPKVLIKQKRNR